MYKNNRRYWRSRGSWNKAHYETLTVILPKGSKKHLSKACDEAGEPMSTYSKKAIEMRMGQTFEELLNQESQESSETKTQKS